MPSTSERPEEEPLLDVDDIEERSGSSKPPKQRHARPGQDAHNRVKASKPAGAVQRSLRDLNRMPSLERAGKQRGTERFVSLPVEATALVREPLAPADHSELPEKWNLFEDGVEVQECSHTGTIKLYCVAEAFDRENLEKRLKGVFPLLLAFEEVMYLPLPGLSPSDASSGDVLIFDYGCVVFWGAAPAVQRQILSQFLVPYAQSPAVPQDVETDEFHYRSTLNEHPHIMNDTFTINQNMADSHLVIISISHALAQSIKLRAYEQKATAIIATTRGLPEVLESTGTVILSTRSIARLMGKVFILKAAVNQLDSVLDPPEFFWDVPDSLQTLYEKVCEYLELKDRTEILNNRFTVLQGMLDILKDYRTYSHNNRAEWIVIWLLVLCVIMAVAQCAGVFFR